MSKLDSLYDLDDLLYLMRRLREPEKGCPWDLKQTYETIVPHTLEEAYEVADAIERGSPEDLRDELGDLLFQVVFYSQLAKEEQKFDFNGITDAIVRKLLRRHPHVFPNENLHAYHDTGTSFSDEDIKQQWEQIKARERAAKPQNDLEHQPSSLLDDIPVNMPALNRAEKLQKRASQHGFDWQSLPPVLDKLEEEIAELKHEIRRFDGRDLRDPEVHKPLLDEMGDVFFCCVNLARFLKVNPDEALRSTNHKFYQRFTYLERSLASQGRKVDDCSLDELDRLWDKAKEALSKS